MNTSVLAASRPLIGSPAAAVLSFAMGDEASYFPVAGQIPVDFKIRKSLTSNGLTVTDARGDLAFRISSPSHSRRIKTLFDAAGEPLITVVHSDGEWQGFKGNSQELKDLIFTAHKVLYSSFNAELDVLLSSENPCDQKISYRLKGNPFRRACTIIMGNSIVAQTNLLYKLRKIIYSRHKFRLTLYPGNDCVLVIAMLITFFWG